VSELETLIAKLLLFSIFRRDADKVDDIMEEIEEAKDVQDRITEAITRPAQEIFDDVSEVYLDDRYN